MRSKVILSAFISPGCQLLVIGNGPFFDSKNYVNLVIAGKQSSLQRLGPAATAAAKHRKEKI